MIVTEIQTPRRGSKHLAQGIALGIVKPREFALKGQKPLLRHNAYALSGCFSSSILICLLLSFFFSLTLSAQGLSEQKIIEKMTTAAEAIKTVQCNFTQTKHTKLLSKGLVSQGRMACQQPDKLRWEYTSPSSSTLILNGTEARLTKDGGTNAGRNKFVGEMARMIMNSVAGKYLTDNKTFQVTAKEMPTEYVATLLPLRKDIKRLYTKLVLHFDLGQSTVTQVEIFEKSGDRTVIDLQDIRINEPINAGTFGN